jgi:hypothetical protein
VAGDEAEKPQPHRRERRMPIHDERRFSECVGTGAGSLKNLVEVVGEAAQPRSQIVFDVAGQEEGKYFCQHWISLSVVGGVKGDFSAADPIGGRWWRLGPLVQRRDMHGGGARDGDEGFHGRSRW